MKVIALHSGGLDSTALLAFLHAEGHEVQPLSFDYGQRHRRELQSAKAICEEYGFPFRVVDVSALKPLMAGSSLTSDDRAVPLGHYEEESMKETVVPNRNMIMLAIAGAWAQQLKFDAIAFAAHAGDHAIYPDCRDAFVRPLREALRASNWHQVDLLAPFLQKTKSDIVEIGSQLAAPLALTWSCYQGEAIHCGKCGTCTERKEAFELAGVPDPTEYQ